MAHDLPMPSDDFERQKWLRDVEFRQHELELRERETAIKEREQGSRDLEAQLKVREFNASQWRSPLVVAILAAAVAGAGNAVVAVVNGNLQRDLENRKREAEIDLERAKSESTRILEMIKTGDTEKAAGNLDFLLQAGLVSDPKLVERVTRYLASRTPGKGPALPSPSSAFDFERTELLTTTTYTALQSLLDDYLKYVSRIGFPPNPRRVTIKVEKKAVGDSYYLDGKIVMSARLADDPSVPLREYNHHILTTGKPDELWAGQYAAVESALADYFACSYLNNPKLGEKAAKTFDPPAPYIRLLANNKKFTEFKALKDPVQFPYEGAEIWGGAFWAIRQELGKETADSILASAWLTLPWPSREEDWAPGFTRAILQAAGSKSARALSAVRTILRDREFPLP
jgi:hypothetical protein